MADVYLQGKISWHRLTIPDQEYDCWYLILYPNKESYDKILELKKGSDGIDGILNEIKKDDDGYNIKLKRPVSKVIKGKVQPFGPPKLFDGKQLLPDGSYAPFNAMIGNGSDVTVRIEYYTYNKPAKRGKGSAIRLASVRVDNLVPYEGKKDFDASETKEHNGLKEQPEQPLW